MDLRLYVNLSITLDGNKIKKTCTDKNLLPLSSNINDFVSKCGFDPQNIFFYFDIYIKLKIKK